MHNLQRAIAEQQSDPARAVRSALLLLAVAQRHATTPAAALLWARERAKSPAVAQVIDAIAARVRVFETAEKKTKKAPKSSGPKGRLLE